MFVYYDICAVLTCFSSTTHYHTNKVLCLYMYKSVSD